MLVAGKSIRLHVHHRRAAIFRIHDKYVILKHDADAFRGHHAPCTVDICIASFGNLVLAGLWLYPQIPSMISSARNALIFLSPLQ